MKTFGASAPLKELQKKFGFTPENVVAAAKQQIAPDEVSHARRDRIDHAGYELKETVKALPARGATTRCSMSGPTTAIPWIIRTTPKAVGAAAARRRAERGIIFCGSGVGASMAANRIPGIRAGLCHDTYSAHQGVEHDDMNVLVLGGRVVGIELARELIHAFLERALHRRGAPSAAAGQDDGARESRCARCRSSASRSGSTTSAAA